MLRSSASTFAGAWLDCVHHAVRPYGLGGETAEVAEVRPYVDRYGPWVERLKDRPRGERFVIPVEIHREQFARDLEE